MLPEGGMAANEREGGGRGAAGMASNRDLRPAGRLLLLLLELLVRAAGGGAPFDRDCKSLNHSNSAGRDLKHPSSFRFMAGPLLASEGLSSEGTKPWVSQKKRSDR